MNVEDTRFERMAWQQGHAAAKADCSKEIALLNEKLQRAEQKVKHLSAVLEGFEKIGFKPCKDPACYRPTLEMMQRSHAALHDGE